MDDVMTQSAMQPPNGGGTALVGGEYPDDVRALGDQIAGLTLLQAKELNDYMKATHGIAFPLV
jgi:hypothetical protein